MTEASEAAPEVAEEADRQSLKRDKSEGSDSEESDVQPSSKRRRKGSDKPKAAPASKAQPKSSPKSPKPSKSKAKATSPPVVQKASGEETPEDPDVSDIEEELSASEEEAEKKPELKKKELEKVQAALKGSGKDPYPDWNAGEPVP
ncbi:hypothetical protein COL922a_014198, partial [Colletotrichum nupharicola]